METVWQYLIFIPFSKDLNFAEFRTIFLILTVLIQYTDLIYCMDFFFKYFDSQIRFFLSMMETFMAWWTLGVSVSLQCLRRECRCRSVGEQLRCRLWMSKSGLVTPNSMSMTQSYSTLETGVPELKPLFSGLKAGPQSPQVACCAVWMGRVATTGLLGKRSPDPVWVVWKSVRSQLLSHQVCGWP